MIHQRMMFQIQIVRKSKDHVILQKSSMPGSPITKMETHQ